MRHLEIVLALVACGATLAAEPSPRWNAPITVQQDAPFVTLPLPASVYVHSLAPGLADVRVVDATGRRVPHAWVPEREAVVQRQEEPRETTAYPLPRRAVPGATLVSPVEVVAQGDSIRVRRLGVDKAARPDTMSPGWLFDLGERQPGQPAPRMLRLAWSGPADFSAAFDIDTSDTLREWHGAGSGQVMALASPSGALVQRDVPLPPDVPRFVRLVWRDPATAAQLTGAQAVIVQQTAQAQEPSETLLLDPSPEPAGKTPPPQDALHFDLGGSMPLVAVDLQLPANTRVAPVRLQARERTDEPWRELASAVFYRLDREGSTSRSPAMALQATARYLRVLPDERMGALDPAGTRLVVKVRLASLVFANQGRPPFSLLAGTRDASSGALPIAALVPRVEEELPRLGRAGLGAWAEDAKAVKQAAAARREAVLRLWLLWGVLVAGVGGLGAMVWKLARRQPPGGTAPRRD